MRYAVYFQVNGTKRVVVEADNKEQAAEKAGERADVCLCHQCSHELDIDGTGEVLEVEVLDEDEEES